MVTYEKQQHVGPHERERKQKAIPMKHIHKIVWCSLMLAVAGCAGPALAAVHVWEKQELTFTAVRSLRQCLRGGGGLGGPEGPGLQEAHLRLLGRRTDFSRAPRGHGARGLELAKRLHAGRRWACREKRRVRGRLPGPRRRSRRTRCAEGSCGRRPTTTRWNKPTARRFSPSATPGGPRAPIVSAGTTTTWSGRSGRPPVSRTTSASARRRATTGSTSSPRFPTG